MVEAMSIIPIASEGAAYNALYFVPLLVVCILVCCHFMGFPHILPHQIPSDQ